MEILERVVVMESDELAEMMDLINSYIDVDCDGTSLCRMRLMKSFEDLLCVYFDLEEYTEDLDELLDKIEELDLFDVIENIIITILNMRMRVYGKFVNLKIFTYNGLIGLIFLIPY